MGFYIDLVKIEETEEYVRYKYSTSEDNAGIIECQKKDGRMIELQQAPFDQQGYIFERAARALVRYWKSKSFPDKTFWAS